MPINHLILIAFGLVYLFLEVTLSLLLQITSPW